MGEGIELEGIALHCIALHWPKFRVLDLLSADTRRKTTPADPTRQMQPTDTYHISST